MNRAKTIQEILQQQREERDRERLAAFLLKIFFAHIIIVTLYFYLSKWNIQSEHNLFQGEEINQFIQLSIVSQRKTLQAKSLSKFTFASMISWVKRF